VAQLFVVLQCGALHAPASRHALSNIDEVHIGRGDSRSHRRTVERGVRRLELRVDDRRMSRDHASLRAAPSGWELHDHGSSNGSRVDGVPVERRALHDGAVIELGHTFLRFRSALPTPLHGPGDLRSDELMDRAPALRTLVPELGMALEQLKRFAQSSLPVMLLGETGTGKEWLARAVHESSGRAGAFVALNCGALPDSLLESTLFGHVKGAFSGALRDEPGYVRASHGGTLFLDEIGDLPPSSQTALLRVLQEREVTAVGSTRAVSVDLRVVSATHAPLLQRVAEGHFREDLFARLSGLTFRAPPLRERIEDLGLIIGQLLPELERHAAGSLTLQPEAARVLLRYSWPRNIRELQQRLAAAAVLSTSRCIELSHLSELGVGSVGSAGTADVGSEPDLERELREQFAAHRGNVTQVARAMGKARVQVQRWMKRFNIDASKFR
jgi:transcriptional regulator with PAS, ATPase and Fis domain